MIECYAEAIRSRGRSCGRCRGRCRGRGCGWRRGRRSSSDRWRSSGYCHIQELGVPRVVWVSRNRHCPKDSSNKQRLQHSVGLSTSGFDTRQGTTEQRWNADLSSSSAYLHRVLVRNAAASCANRGLCSLRIPSNNTTQRQVCFKPVHSGNEKCFLTKSRKRSAARMMGRKP